MSRSSAVQRSLGDNLRVKSIKPTGDCFYETIVSAFDTVDEDVRDIDGIETNDDDSAVRALRRFSA